MCLHSGDIYEHSDVESYHRVQTHRDAWYLRFVQKIVSPTPAPLLLPKPDLVTLEDNRTELDIQL